MSVISERKYKNGVNFNPSFWTQGIILPQVYTAALAVVAEAITNYILLYVLDLGIV